MVKISGVHKNICHLNEETSGGAGAVTRGGAAGTAARLEAGGREKEVSESPALVEVVVGGGEVRLATAHSTLGEYKQDSFHISLYLHRERSFRYFLIIVFSKNSK